MIKAGRIYKITHKTKGTFECRIVYIAKKHVYATITDSLDIWDLEEQWGHYESGILIIPQVGDDIRFLKRNINIKEK